MYKVVRGKAVDLSCVNDGIEGCNRTTHAGHLVLLEDDGRFRPALEQLL
ncbi:MAG: hypothetical protein WBP47_04490 [Candidatus Promineifilaceae bacterium]